MAGRDEAPALAEVGYLQRARGSHPLDAAIEEYRATKVFASFSGRLCHVDVFGRFQSNLQLRVRVRTSCRMLSHRVCTVATILTIAGVLARGVRQFGVGRSTDSITIKGAGPRVRSSLN